MRHFLKTIIGLALSLLLAGGLEAQTDSDGLARGKALLRAGRADSARMVLRPVADAGSPSVRLEALALLARVALRTQELPVADSLLRVGMPLADRPEATPSARGEYFLSRGEYFRETSQLEAALEQYRRVIRLADRAAGMELTGAYGLFYTGLTFERLGVYDSSLVYVERAFPVFRSRLDTTSLAFSAIYNGMGVSYFRANRLGRAEDFFLRSKAIAEERVGPISEDVAICLNNLSSIARSQEDYEQAIAYAEAALRIYRRLEDESGAAGAYYSLGIYHYFTGDYGRARDHLRAGIEIRERLYGADHYSLVSPYEVMGIIYETDGDYDRTLDYLRKSLGTIRANFPPGSLREGFNYENTAIAYSSIGRLDSALHYIRRAHALLPGQLPDDDYSLAVHYYSYARICYEREELGAARDWLERSNEIYRALGLDRASEYAQNLALRALIAGERGNWERADAIFARALAIIRAPGAATAEEYQLTPNSLELLNEYSGYLYRKYVATGEPAALRAFERYSQRYLELSDAFRRQFVDPYTKSVLSKDNAEVYGRNIGIYYRLYRQNGRADYLATAYRFSEYGRTSLLRDLQDDKVRSYAGVPDSVLQRERRLQKEVAGLRQQLLATPDSDSLRQALFMGKERLNEHIERTRENYPKYYDLKYNTTVPSLAAIRAELPTGHNWIEYMMDDTAYYALTIHPEAAEFRYLGDKEKIDSLVLVWQQQLTARQDRSYQMTARALYDLLWRPVAADLRGDRVTIVPSGTLFYVNFETLPGAQAAYLIEEYEINYALSITVQFATPEPSPYRGLVAIAPGFEPEIKAAYRARLDTLQPVDEDYLRTVRQPWSLRLVRELGKRFAIHALTGVRATEANLKDNIDRGSVLYFGTHAIADPTDPLRSRLVLAKEVGPQREDGYLHAYELYGLPLNADLAVLNACESGIGNLQQGEGMISLAYSIHYAGCPSTVMSLWKVDEKISTRITEQMLTYLAEGDATGTALRRAKLDYLREAQGPLRHPFYWGGMVLLGPDRPVALDSRLAAWWWYLAGTGLVAVLGFLLWRYRRSRTG